MRNEEKTTTKTVVNVGYCESTSEWLNRIMTELADESKNFIELLTSFALNKPLELHESLYLFLNKLG